MGSMVPTGLVQNIQENPKYLTQDFLESCIFSRNLIHQGNPCQKLIPQTIAH